MWNVYAWMNTCIMDVVYIARWAGHTILSKYVRLVQTMWKKNHIH